MYMKLKNAYSNTYDKLYSCKKVIQNIPRIRQELRSNSEVYWTIGTRRAEKKNQTR